MAHMMQTVCFALAVATAAGLGAAAARIMVRWRQRWRYRAAAQGDGCPAGLRHATGVTGMGESSFDVRIIAYAMRIEQQSARPQFHFVAPAPLRERPWMEERASPAGLEGRLGSRGFWEARVRLALGGALAGCAMGLLTTVELGAFLAVVGALVGWRALPWAVRRRTRERAESMERDLSEMLDVVALGMRSGLSFDRSLQLYTDHFKTLLAESFRSAHRQWTCGLASRPDALRAVAASYDSALLGRVVENVIRSLRFGATLADNLEDAAREARSGYRARKQEQVAKAPVKMMVPTGALILPAMLILVLGPVLLELAGGF